MKIVALVVLTLLLCAGTALAAGKKVLVLPFQVTAGPSMPNASRDVPQQIIDQLEHGVCPWKMQWSRNEWPT